MLQGNKRYTVAACIILMVPFLFAIFFYREYSIPRMKLIVTSIVRNIATNSSLWQWNDGKSHPPRVICMIFTMPSTWESKGKAVRNTWAKRCNKAIFFYSKVNNCTHSICNETNAVGLNIPDGRDHLTAKSLGGLNYSYNKYGDEADYFLKADDDTYVIMENLQLILSNFSSYPLLYLGRKIQNIVPKGYNSGGAGYIISNKAAKLVVQNGTSSNCRSDGGFEDVEIGACLSRFGIYPQDELDSTGRLTFHSDNPFLVFHGAPVAGAYYINMDNAEFGNRKTKETRGFMLSDLTATMHYISPGEMYMYEFLLYHVHRGSRRNIDE